MPSGDPVSQHDEAIDLDQGRSADGSCLLPPSPRRILVISDALPDSAGSGRDRRLLQLLRALRDLGDEIAFAAREGINREHKHKECEPPLHQLGIQIYANDSEYMASLDRKVDTPTWSLPDLVTRTHYDIAILIQNFDCGISVPELYLDNLRQHTPNTRIAVLADELHMDSRKRGDAAIVDCERLEDWSARQWETFERADAVLVQRESDAAMLQQAGRGLQVEVVNHHLKKEVLGEALQRVNSCVPKARAKEAFSVSLVDGLFSERLSGRVGEDRLLGQFECYARLAEVFFREGKAEEALTHLRHIFGRSPQSMHAGYFASQIFIILMRCYRMLGDLEMAERCAAEARRRVIVQSLPAVKQAKPGGLRFRSLSRPTIGYRSYESAWQRWNHRHFRPTISK